MKYRIKKPDIEKAIRGLFTTQEAFEKELNHWSEHHFKYHPDYIQLKIEANSAESITGLTCELYVATSDIEEVAEYDPKAWNEFPKVKPPEPGFYLITNNHGVCAGGFWDEHRWNFPLDLDMGTVCHFKAMPEGFGGEK